MIPTDLAGVDQAVATGALPGWERVEELVVEAHRRHSGDRSGEVADYIPILGAADPELFEQVDAAVTVNEDSRLGTLRLGLLILAGISALAILPASRLPRYKPDEIPDPDPVAD